MKTALTYITIALSTCISQAWSAPSSHTDRLSALKARGIETATDSKIRELYEKLNTQISELENIETQYTDALTENAQNMRNKEQSAENKLLGATGMTSVGIGGMQMASAISEQNADTDAQSNMRAYLATFICNYGDGKNFPGGTQNIELPASDLLTLKSEYITLAKDLQHRKTILSLAPGIESEIIPDSATSGLYDDVAIGKTDGAFTSLAAAISDPTGTDATEWNSQKSATTDKLKSGTITAGAGAIGSAVANLVINKDAPTENSKQIKSEYESKKRDIKSEISDTETELNNAIAANKQRIDEYNTKLAQHQDFTKTITETDCLDEFAEYTNYISGLKTITDEFTDTSNLSITYDLKTQQAAYQECVDSAILARQIKECESQPYHKWINNTCVDQTPSTSGDITDTNPAPQQPDQSPNSNVHNPNKTSVAMPASTASNPDDTQKDQQTADADQCPAENPRMPSLTSKNRVGDFCKYGNVAIGTVFKRPDGTCSCTATQCIPGYKLKGGMCNECDTNYKMTDGKCTLDASAPAGLPGQVPVKYFEVCKKDKDKSDGTEHCVEKPFNWTNVQMLQATALAAEYALVKNKHKVVCENEWRKSDNDDWFSCTSTDNKHFYEFKFDDVAESVDTTIQTHTKRALCEALYDGKFNATKTFIYDPDCELSDESKREQLKTSAEKFSFTATIGKTGVNFGSTTKMNYTTQKIDNLDPFAFYNGDIQIRANGKMIDGIFAYVTNKLSLREVKTFTCNVNPRQITGTIDNRKVKGSSDDVLTCHINGTPVDFVFDDMSELSKKLSRGGYSNMNCTAYDGTYNGYECMYVTKDYCERIQKLSAATMPANKLPFWDETHKECQLPAAADATQYQRNMNISIMVGGVIVGAVVTVVTGGTAAPALALLGVETVGGIVEIKQTNKIYQAIDEFLTESQKCKDATCAESMLRSNLQRMSNMTFDMTDAQINGIDAELSRLADEIPTDSEFYRQIAENGATTADNKLGFFDADAWEQEQIWRAVGIALQLTSLITGIGKWVVGKVNKLPRATRTIAQNAAKNADSTIKMTATQAKRLDEIDARLTKIQAELNANPSASRAAELRAERTRLTQEKNTILNKVGTKNADEIANAKSAAYSAKEIADAQRELNDARSALQKRLDWESKQSPGALKNDLQSRNSAGRTARNKVRAAEQKLRDMGETVAPMEFRSVDDILGSTTDTAKAAKDAGTNADNASDASHKVFDVKQMKFSDGSNDLYVRHTAKEILGTNVKGNEANSQIDDLYGAIRRGIEYPVDDTKVSKAINAMERPNNNDIIYLAPSNHFPWHVHYYKGAAETASSKINYHLSLNVNVDDELIRKLDNIISQDKGQHIINFKIPPKGTRWKTMADPITIYMRNTSPEIERAIANAAAGHIRTTSDIGLLGRKIDNGIAIAYETSGGRKDIVANIINEVAKKDENVANQLLEQKVYSVGMTEALRLWASDFLGKPIPAIIPSH